MQPRISLLVPTFLLALGGGWAARSDQDAAVQHPPETQDSPEAKGSEKSSPGKNPARGADEATRAERLLAKQREVEEAERKLAYSKVEITLAEMKTETELAAAELAVEDATREVARAEAALEGFAIAFDAGRLEAELKVARAENSLLVARSDLDGIMEIYAEEREARAKKEIVRRHEASVRFAEQGVQVARLEAKKQIEHDLPRERDDLRWKVEKAKAALKKARAEVARTQLAGELERTRARDAEVAAKRALSDLRRVHKRLRNAAAKPGAKSDR